MMIHTNVPRNSTVFLQRREETRSAIDEKHHVEMLSHSMHKLCVPIKKYLKLGNYSLDLRRS